MATRVALPGFVLLHQFAVPGGFVLVLDDDCPFEEVTTFCLLGGDLRVRSVRSVGRTGQLEAIEWLDARRFVADFGEQRVGFRVRARGVPYVWPRLGRARAEAWRGGVRFETRG